MFEESSWRCVENIPIETDGSLMLADICQKGFEGGEAGRP